MMVIGKILGYELIQPVLSGNTFIKTQTKSFASVQDIEEKIQPPLKDLKGFLVQET